MTLVPLDRHACPDCAQPLGHLVIWQRALLRHAGYGATRRSVVRRCPACGWHLEAEQSEVTPRPAAGHVQVYQLAWTVFLVMFILIGLRLLGLALR